MICGKTLKDKIRNECIREITGVESTTEVMKSQRLRRYRHVERMTEEKALIMARKILVYGKKIGRSKKWIELVTEDIRKSKLEDLIPTTNALGKKAAKTGGPLASTNKHQVSINEETNGR